MNTLKTILAITALVLIGFIAGFYVHRQMSMRFIHHVKELRQAKGFEEQFMKRLNLSASQQEEIEPIVRRYSVHIDELHREFRDSRHHLIDSMHQEVKPFLNAGQIEKLQQLFSRRFQHDMKKRRKKIHGREKMSE